MDPKTHHKMLHLIDEIFIWTIFDLHQWTFPYTFRIYRLALTPSHWAVLVQLLSWKFLYLNEQEPKLFDLQTNRFFISPCCIPYAPEACAPTPSTGLILAHQWDRARRGASRDKQTIQSPNLMHISKPRIILFSSWLRTLYRQEYGNYVDMTEKVSRLLYKY